MRRVGLVGGHVTQNLQSMQDGSSRLRGLGAGAAIAAVQFVRLTALAPVRQLRRFHTQAQNDVGFRFQKNFAEPATRLPHAASGLR